MYLQVLEEQDYEEYIKVQPVDETLGGHIVELDFDKCEIEDSRLVG